MAKLNLKITPPSNAAINEVFDQIERKYLGLPLTPVNIDNMEHEAARLIRRLITTKVEYVK